MIENDFWKDSITIAGRSFPRFVGGPVDGVTDSPFRRILRRFSLKELLYTEIRHVAAIANEKDGRSLDFDDSERPLAFQITASSTDFVREACAKTEARGVDFVDLNIACPARSIVGSGAGVQLMDDLLMLASVLKKLKENLSVPITIKMRAGYSSKNAVEVAKICEDSGVAAIAIHPRLRKEKFSGELDYALVCHVRDAVSIPIIFSGGIVSSADAEHVYEACGADGYMVSRGLWGAPWRLAELSAKFCGEPFVLTSEQWLETVLIHFRLMLDYYGSSGLFAFRKHLAYYLRGVSSASKMRAKLMVCDDISQVERGLTEFARTLPEFVVRT